MQIAGQKLCGVYDTHMYLGVTLRHSICHSPNSFSYRGSYFKYRGEGSQIFWIRFGGGCQAGCRPRRRLMFSWWCVWVNVRRFFGFVLRGNR